MSTEQEQFRAQLGPPGLRKVSSKPVDQLQYMSEVSPPVNNYDKKQECTRCHEKGIDYDQVRVYSTDDGVTSFHECRSCKFQWTVPYGREHLWAMVTKAREDFAKIPPRSAEPHPMMERSISLSLECARCCQKQVSYSEARVQKQKTGSPDSEESPLIDTIFCQCMVCGNSWKMDS